VTKNRPRAGVEPGTAIAGPVMIAIQQGLADHTIAVVLGGAFGTFLGIGMIAGGVVVGVHLINQDSTGVGRQREG